MSGETLQQRPASDGAFKREKTQNQLNVNK
jgi:hypothetical protein